MAEAVVSAAIQSITNLASDATFRKATFLCGVREEVGWLEDELKRMQCFLKDADRRQEQDERVRNWVAEIRDLAYDAEDAIDTFAIKIPRREGGIRGHAKELPSIFTKCFHQHNVGKQIQSIRTKLEDVGKSLQTYGIRFIGDGEGSSSASETQRSLRRSYPNVEEEHVTGLEGITHSVVAQLMVEEDRLSAVSIVGMGGLGKTTLAKKVYNREDVRRHFDCYSWAFLSQQFSVKNILFGILKAVVGAESRDLNEEELGILKAVVGAESRDLNGEELVVALHDALKEKRYLVVLDDIWSNVDWDRLKAAFPKGKNGSKLLFTTRNKGVALHADPRSTPIEPPLLSDDEGWLLFRKKAFPRDVDKHGIPPEFEELGKEMVEKCGGLPLAIVVLGGLLVTKSSLDEWKTVHRSIHAQFVKLQERPEGHGGVYGILALSYSELPFYLKPCFLYFSHFPEDYEIHKKQLIRLWIAEGFVTSPPSPSEETLEEVGEGYLEELISRCMVQVSKRDYKGGVKTIRIHDLMRDMCFSKARDENFLEVFVHVSSTGSESLCPLPSTSKARRIAIHFFDSPVPITELAVGGGTHIRSLSYFHISRRWSDNFRKEVKFLIKNFTLLRVLNLDDVIKEDILVPKAIGNLIHLRYFSLQGRNLKGLLILPASIGNLRKLTTLRVKTLILRDEVRLPNVLRKLECLRHLVIRNNTGSSDWRIETLVHLETLGWVSAKSLIRRDAMLKLTRLRNLKIVFEREEEVELVLDSPIFGSDGHLCTLSMGIGLDAYFDFPSLQQLSQCRQLTKLRLTGAFKGNLGILPTSLVKLTLEWSRLQQDPTSILEKLPNLRVLLLMCDAYRGSKMVCSARGFPQLEILELQFLRDVEEWEIEEGAMPCLRTLIIRWMDKLKMIPEGLKFVTTLQQLTLFSRREEFKNRVEIKDGVEGEDFYKVQHIPTRIVH